MTQTDMLFSAELRNIKVVYNIFRAISFRETAVIRATSEGLKVTVEELRSIQTSGYIPVDVFCNYNLYADDDVYFKINMKMLTECLNIFGDDGNTGLKMMYKQIGEPLILMLDHDEENITVECKLATLELDEMLDLNLALECKVNHVIVRAQFFVSIIHDLDNSSDYLDLLLSPDAPFFRITTIGTLGECQVDISPSSEMVEVFQCTQTTRYRYTLAHIKQLERVMGNATRISISIGDEAGMLCLQLVIDAGSSLSSTVLSKMFVEYFCTALLDEDE